MKLALCCPLLTIIRTALPPVSLTGYNVDWCEANADCETPGNLILIIFSQVIILRSSWPRWRRALLITCWKPRSSLLVDADPAALSDYLCFPAWGWGWSWVLGAYSTDGLWSGDSLIPGNQQPVLCRVGRLVTTTWC